MMFWIGFFIGGIVMFIYLSWFLGQVKKQELNRVNAENIEENNEIECLDITASLEPPDAYTFKESKFEIPTHDPQTGQLNPYYEELTGKKNPLSNL